MILENCASAQEQSSHVPNADLLSLFHITLLGQNTHTSTVQIICVFFQVRFTHIKIQIRASETWYRFNLALIGDNDRDMHRHHGHIYVGLSVTSKNYDSSPKINGGWHFLRRAFDILLVGQIIDVWSRFYSRNNINFNPFYLIFDWFFSVRNISAWDI